MGVAKASAFDKSVSPLAPRNPKVLGIRYATQVYPLSQVTMACQPQLHLYQWLSISYLLSGLNIQVSTVQAQVVWVLSTTFRSGEIDRVHFQF